MPNKPAIVVILSQHMYVLYTCADVLVHSIDIARLLT